MLDKILSFFKKSLKYKVFLANMLTFFTLSDTMIFVKKDKKYTERNEK